MEKKDLDTDQDFNSALSIAITIAGGCGINSEMDEPFDTTHFKFTHDGSFDRAVFFENLSDLGRLYKRGVIPKDPRVFAFAAKRSRGVKVLEWLKAREFPWDERATVSALEGDLFGKYENLKWLIENGCPCDYRVATSFAMIENLPMLKYLQEKGCPIEYHAFEAVVAEQKETTETGRWVGALFGQ